MAEKNKKSNLVYHIWDADNKEYEVPDSDMQELGYDNIAKTFEGGYITMFDDKKQKVDVPIEDARDYRNQGYMWYDASGSATPINEVGKKPFVPQQVETTQEKQPGLISQALGMLKPTEMSEKQQQRAKELPFAKRQESLANKQMDASLASPNAPVETIAGAMGVAGKQVADPINQWSAAYENYYGKEGVDPFQSVVQDIMSTGAGDEDPNVPVQMAYQALERFADRTAKAHTQALVANLPEGVSIDEGIENQWYSHDVQDKLQAEAKKMGISYDDYVALFLKPSLVQSLKQKIPSMKESDAEGIALRLFSHEDDMENRLFDKDIADMLGKYMDEPIDNAITKAGNEAKASLGDAINRAKENTGPLQQYELLKGILASNKLKDPERVKENLQGQIEDILTNTDITLDLVKLMDKKGLSYDKLDEVMQKRVYPAVMNVLESKLSDKYIQKYMPKGSLEYIVKSAINNTIAGKVYRKMTQSDYQNWLEDMAYQQYQPGFWERVGSGALTFAGDAWSYWVPGLAGGKLTKSIISRAEASLTRDLVSRGVAGQTAARLARIIVNRSKARMLGTGAVNGAVTFGGQQVISTPVDEGYRSGQFDENGNVYHTNVGKVVRTTAKNATRESLMGAVLQGGTVANMIGKGRGLAANILADVGGKAFDSALMTGSGILEQKMADPSYQVTGKGVAENFLESGANLLAISFPHIVRKYVNFKDAQAFNKAAGFNKDDIATMKKAGYGDLHSALEKLATVNPEYRTEGWMERELANAYADPSIKFGAGKNVEDKTAYLTDEYKNFLKDKAVPQTLKIKLQSVIEGKVPNRLPAIIDSRIVSTDDGKVNLETYDVDGNIVTRQVFDSKEKADEANNQITLQKDLNAISLSENLYEANVIRDKIQQLYNDAQEKYAMGKPLSDEEKSAVYLYQQANHVTSLRSKLADVRSLTPEEQRVSLNDNDRRFVETYEKMLGEFKGNQDSELSDYIHNFETSLGLKRGSTHRALEGHTKEEADRIVALNKSNARNSEFKNGVTYHSLYEPDGKDGETTFIPIGNGRYRTVMEQRIVDAYRNQLLNDVGIRTEMRETEKEISNPNEEVESIPEQVSPVNSSLATENTEAETTQPQGGANISPEVAPQEEQPTPSGDGTASADGTSSGQESPVSSEPAPYQDRTKTVPTPNNAEFAANPANVSNSSAEGASPETKVAGSDAFVMGQNAYKNGDTEGLKSIKYNAETAELRLKRAFANDTDRIQGVYNAVNKGTDIETYIEQRTNYLTPFQQEAIRKYAEAMDANKGAMDALEHADDGYADMLKQQLSQYTMENGNISSLTLTDGQRGYWKSKNEYGAGFGIFPDANGQPVVKQVPSSQVKENGKEIPLQEYVNQLVTQKHEATKKNFNAIFDATSLKPNDTVSLSINDKDQPTEAKIVSVNPDGTISFNIAGSKNVTTVPVDTFNKFQKYALRNSINAELDAEDAERAEKEAIKVEAEKKQRFANGIVGLSEQKPDYSSKGTDPKVAAEYLQEQYADNHDQLIKLVNGSRSDIKEQIDNIRKRIVEAEDWLDTNADLEPEQAQSREDKLKLAKEQLEDLTNRYDNWNKIRSLIMTEEEKRELKDERTANIKKVGIDKEALTVTDEREVPVLTDEELKKQYPTMDEASDYILSQRKEISKTQEELHRQLEDIDDRLNQYLLGESDLTDEEIRDFNTTKADLEARMANLTESAKELKAQADKLKKLYVQENKKERAAILAEMTPAEQRRVKAEQYLNDGNISGLMKLYADTSVDFTDDHPYTVDEYVASSIGRHALNYEGREVNGTFLNGLQQEFGGTRKDLEKIQVLAAEGKGQTFDKYVNGLYDNLPDNLRNQGVNTQEIRNSLLALLRGAEKYSDLKNYILKEKIAHAEEEMRSMDLAEEEQRAAYEEEKEQQMQEQVDDVSAKYSLSSETAGNGEQFYQDAEGNIDLANVPQEVFEQIGYTAAPFRLTSKMIKHMMDRHNTELKFSSPDEAIDFVRDVMNNFDHVRLGYDGALVFSIEDGRRRTGKRAVTILINNDNGKFYGLKTSGYESVKGLEKRPLLWERGANEKTSSTDAATASVTTSKSSLSSEQSGSASHQGNDLNSSGGKDTNNSDNLQEKGTKFSEKLQNAIAETETKPTEAQKKAGNYKKGHLSFGGYDFTVETPKGVTRSGKDEQGKPWSVTMHDTYGYILGKIGVDGDHIDMFINDVADLDTFDGNVYVVDQVNPETGEFDEHKVMYGYPSEEAATEAYLANYSKGWKGLGKVTSVPKATFDKWLESSDRKTKPFADYTMVQTSLQKNNSSIQKDNPVIREARKRVSDALDALDKFKAEKQAFYKKIKGIFKNKPETDAIEEARKLIAKWRNDSYAVMSIDGFDYNQKYQGANLPGEVYRAYEKAYKAISGVDHKIEHVSGTGFIGTISDSAALEDYINGLYAMFIGGKLGKKFYLEDNLPEIQKQVYKIAEDDIKLGRVLSREGVKYYDPNLKYADPKLFDDPLVPNETFDGWLENPNKKQDDNLPFAPMNMDELPFHRDVKEVKPENLTEAQKVAYDAVSTMLKKAGIPVKVVSNEDMEKVAEAQDNLAVEMLLNDPRLRFYIKTPEQKEAAKAAYDWAAKNRPDKFKQYAIVNMDNPNQPPQYFEKKALAEKWRKYYTNAWKIGNYKAFNLNKPFEEQIKDVKGDVPSEFDPYKAESLLNKRIELEKQIKETEDSYNAKKKERADYQNQLMQDYMDQHGLSSENDIPDDVWTDYRDKSFEKYQDTLDDLFHKYVELDNQLKAVAEPGVQYLKGKGVVYGYTDGKEIVLNQDHLNPNTPIHEYQHLWRTAAKNMNPELIEHGDKLIMQTQLFADLKQDPNYNHLTDEQICDEAFARLTGEDGAAILEQMAKDAIKENPLDTAKELSVINKLKEWLKKFWYWTLETFTKWKPEDIKKMTLEDIRNLVLRDLANGVDPRNVLKGQMTKDEAVSLRQQMADNAEPERILEHTEDNWLQDFGKDGRVNTPIGSIKLGENQYKKAGREDRIKRFGLLKPTLERPDVILEKPAPKEGAERQTKYLFVKSFKKVDGTKILNFESITVKQGEDEVSISAHQIEPSKLLKELTESKLLWNRFRGDSNSLGENQGSALTPSANNPSGKDSVLNPHSKKANPSETSRVVENSTNTPEGAHNNDGNAFMRAKVDNNSETAKENGGNLSVEDKIKAVSQQFGVDEADVAMYANAVKKGSTAEAARARANIKRHLMQVNEGNIFSFKDVVKYTKPINEALKENFGDLDAMIEERIKQVEAERNAMEAARKRAEEEAKRKKHLEELSLIPDDKLDKQYMDALSKGDDATAREMLDEAARRKGYDDTESAYQGLGAWAAPGNPGYESDKARRDDWESSGSDVNLEDMALGYTPQPDDYFSHPERYSQNTPHGLESVKAINTAIDAIKNGEKDVKVKVYRAVPTSVKEGKLRNGDWVTPSKKYAEMHGTNRLEGKYRIIEDEVPATQLWWDGNDANEFGFDDGKEYKYKNAKNNRKLNDLVTYDDEGDVIPPSKRFNSRKQDVRFHRSDGANLPSEEDNKPKKKTERGRIDEATGAFKLAPNGEQSNLSKKQYIEARTKNFKEWFGGDWEKKPKDFKNKLDANGEPLEKYVEGYLNRPKKPTMPKKRKGEDEATFFGRKMLYSQALEDWPKTEADWKKRIDEFDENTLATLTPPDEEAIREKYQKQYENDMASWRKDHPKIKEGEERPLKIPDMRDYQSIQDYGEALRKHEIWKTAPHKDEYVRMAEDEIISKVALMDAVQHPFSEYARLKAMKAEFQHMRHVMQNQKVYDQNTTDAVVQFAKRFMSLGYGDDLGRGSINTLLTIVKNSTGKKSYEISQQLYQVMDVLMNNQLRNFDRAVMKTMSIKELKENAKGIQVQGKLELRGQTTIKAFRDAVSSRISSDKLDERISNLIDKMAADKKNASSYQDELLGLNLAKQYVDYIDSSRNDAIEIEDLKKLEIENYKDRKGIYKGERTKALLQEHVERLNQYDEALFNNKVERMDRYSQLLANLGGMIDESVKGAREFQKRDARRAINVKMMASADLGDKSMNQHHKENWKTRLSNSDVARLFCSPLGSFDALMREFGSKQINGEGQLWNHFVRGAMKASNDEFKSVREANNEIDLKVSELFGKITEDKNGNKKGNMILNDLYALERSNKIKSLDVTIRDIEGEQTYKLQQGNLMYIYMVNKMPDGAMKLREMGILDADVERIKENIDPRFLKLADWIQGEFLPKMRTKYNKRHEELFGAPMPMVENYFPLRVLKNARYMEEDVNNTSDGSNALPSTATGAIIKRKTNKLPLDILNADALSVTIDNIKEMENWYNYAPIRKDANTLLSDTTFRNRVQNMTTIYGSGERLWNNVKDATAVAMGTYRPKGGTDLAVSIKNIGKGITGAKISGRLYTAFKQILSFPLFLADADLGRFAWYSANPYGSFKWAIENMPNFDKRWSGRKLGDTVLMDDPTDWKLWHTNLMEKAAYYGMTPNALVDAVTCAVGARAVYDTKYKQYIKAGLTEEKAKEKALSDAEINFNTSQQSSEGAFVSPMQLDRTLESAIFTPFRNSSMLYERKGINALRNLKHRFEKGHKEASIKYMAAQLMEEGVGYEQATKAAEKMYKKGLMHNIADAIVALWLGPIIWNLGGSLGYLIPYLGDDENKKKKMVIDAVILGLLEGPVDGLAGGQFINTAIANTITSDGISLKGLKNVDFSGMPMLSDFNSMIEKFGYDKVAGAQDLMFMVMQSATGFNPKTLTDAINACIDYGNGDMTNAKEIALFVFRLMNGPAATVDNLYIDELGMKGKDAKKLSYEELAKRYAEYKFGKNTFGLGKLYSDEEKQKKLKAIEKSFDKKVSERLAGMDREDLKNEFSESRSQKEKKLIGKIIADELETKDSEAVKKAKADASYLRQRNFSDLMDDLYLQKEWETTNAANAGLEELKGNGASEEEIEAYKTKHKAALDKREAIQEARKEMQEKKADISSDNDEATMAAIRKLRDSILKTVRQTKK